MHGGKRVWIRELMALAPLGDAPLESAVPSQPAAEIEHPPIPVRLQSRRGRVCYVGDRGLQWRSRSEPDQRRVGCPRDPTSCGGTAQRTSAATWMRRPTASIESPRSWRQSAPIAWRGWFIRRSTCVTNSRCTTPETRRGPQPTTQARGSPTIRRQAARCLCPRTKLPGGKALVYLGSYVSEGRDGLAWVDLDGSAAASLGWEAIGLAALFLVRDAGEQAAANTYLYSGAAWEGELRLTAMTAQGDKPVVKYPLPCGRARLRLSPWPGWRRIMACSRAACAGKRTAVRRRQSRQGPGQTCGGRSPRPGVRLQRATAGPVRAANAAIFHRRWYGRVPGTQCDKYCRVPGRRPDS